VSTPISLRRAQKMPALLTPLGGTILIDNQNE
jgi:hypothetical protein